ncbi:MAG TPA: hypothetical protein EYG90_04965 [Campylobacterales bacterium]|nr:hypothetical protein [Campylobacterales bacterium]
MSLPNITIPVELPIDIPTLLHPAVVHFVIAIPVVIILLEIINLFFKKRALSIFSLFLVIVLAVVMSMAYFTGVVDGKETFMALASEGQAELKEHKLLGIYLTYASLALVAFKLLFMAFSKTLARLFFLLILIGFTAVTLKQGKEGGELVYTYGANNEAVNTVQSELDDLQDEYDELEEKQKELSEKSSEGDTETATKLQELQVKYDELVKSSEKEAEEPVAVVSEEATTTEVTESSEEPTETVTPTVEHPEELNSSVEPTEEATAEVSTEAVNLEIPSDSNESNDSN